jgi:hypothetical protein
MMQSGGEDEAEAVLNLAPVECRAAGRSRLLDEHTYIIKIPKKEEEPVSVFAERKSSGAGGGGRGKDNHVGPSFLKK